MSVTAEAGHGLWELSAEAVTAWATLGASVFAAITALIAAIAALIAVGQIKEARKTAKDAEAQESYRSYLEACVNNPELASANYATIKSDFVKREKYNWFVSYLLAASEKILESAGNVSEWISTIKLNISYHKALILDKEQFEDEQLACYDVRLRKLIFDATGRCLKKDNFKATREDQSLSVEKTDK